MIRFLGAAVVLSVAILSLGSPSASAAIIGYWGPNMNGQIEVTPNNSAGTGTAWVEYDDVAHTMIVHANFSGLTGTTTAAHIHAATAAPFTGGAGVATQTPTFATFPNGVTSGTMPDTLYDLTQASSWNPSYVSANGGSPATAEVAFFNAMNTGRAYFNIHTSAFGAGEIRSFMVVPEPGALDVARRRRRGRDRAAADV